MKTHGVDVETWKDLPATFRETKEETLSTKNNKNWKYLINVAIETVFGGFVKKFDHLFSSTRDHVLDGYWQDKTFSMLFENGSLVISLTFFVKLLDHLLEWNGFEYFHFWLSEKIK